MKQLLLVCILYIACSPKMTTNNFEKIKLVENTTHLQDPSLAPFYHGVASGDPMQNSVVLWTRITPVYRGEELTVTWEISEDPSFSINANSGQAATSSDKDYTVKVIASNLEPNTKYFFRFKFNKSYSIIGTTKTLPDTEEEINLAIVSCSNIEFGYFNTYAAICEDDIDAVVHLGDYIYEYGSNVYGDATFHRKNIPATEIISLQDYRDRYSQYRLDQDLRAAHASFPFINIWDDHEIANNAHMTGAQNHQTDEGDYQIRKDIAKKVFYEWLPIREDGHHYRKFSFGKNVELIMLDERLAGRTSPPDSINDPKRTEPEHTLLGDAQMAWLKDALSESNATWKIIGNQVIFSYCDWGYDGFRINMDAWDGYPQDQNELAQYIKGNDIKNIVFVTGDTHSAWAFEATNDPFNSYNQLTGEGAFAVEIGITSITSGNSDERSSLELTKEHEKRISNSDLNPHLKYVNMHDHGYVRLSINAKELVAEYKMVPTLKTRTNKTNIDKTIKIKRGEVKISFEN